MIDRGLAVIDHRIRDHSIRDHTPKVSVFTESAGAHGANVPLTTAAIKRHRFIQNLKNNHQKLIEALAFVERFAVVCELSEERLQAIRKAKNEAEEELAVRYQEKLKAYEERIKDDSK